MNTLTILNIFSNFSFYKENYLSLIHDPTHYFTPVEDAYIEAWPAAKKSLVLGDLLQLWFSEKWLLNDSIQKLFDVQSKKRISVLSQDVYVYQITGNLLTGSNQSKAWSLKKQQGSDVSLDRVVKFYAECWALNRPHFNFLVQHKTA